MTPVNLNAFQCQNEREKDPKRLEAKRRHRVNRNAAAGKAKSV